MDGTFNRRVHLADNGETSRTFLMSADWHETPKTASGSEPLLGRMD
jgi:hypothetical protein